MSWVQETSEADASGAPATRNPCGAKGAVVAVMAGAAHDVRGGGLPESYAFRPPIRTNRREPLHTSGRGSNASSMEGTVPRLGASGTASKHRHRGQLGLSSCKRRTEMNTNLKRLMTATAVAVLFGAPAFAANHAKRYDRAPQAP
jgi:hypothetical protein